MARLENGKNVELAVKIRKYRLIWKQPKWMHRALEEGLGWSPAYYTTYLTGEDVKSAFKLMWFKALTCKMLFSRKLQCNTVIQIQERIRFNHESAIFSWILHLTEVLRGEIRNGRPWYCTGSRLCLVDSKMAGHDKRLTSWMLRRVKVLCGQIQDGGP